jgi:predicted AlkP superfamily pyrophosphatase or phosphodiesterase
MKRIILVMALLSAACLASSQHRVRRVLIIGVDGLRPDMMMQANTPFFDSLMRTGAVSLRATNAWTPEKAWNGHSATNWGALLTGLSPETTDLTANGDGVHSVDAGHHSLFGHLKKADPSIVTGVFNTWGGIGMAKDTILQASGNLVDHHYHSTDGEMSSADRDVLTVAAASKVIKETDLAAAFIHLSACDAAGHGFNYDSPQYIQAVEHIDLLCSRLYRALRSRKTFAQEDWLIMLSADHGGPDGQSGHGDNTNPQVYTVPFIAHGGPITAGLSIGKPSLYDMTPSALAWVLGPESANGLAGRPVWKR